MAGRLAQLGGAAVALEIQRRMMASDLQTAPTAGLDGEVFGAAAAHGHHASFGDPSFADDGRAALESDSELSTVAGVLPPDGASADVPDLGSPADHYDELDERELEGRIAARVAGQLRGELEGFVAGRIDALARTLPLDGGPRDGGPRDDTGGPGPSGGGGDDVARVEEYLRRNPQDRAKVDDFERRNPGDRGRAGRALELPGF